MVWRFFEEFELGTIQRVIELGDVWVRLDESPYSVCVFGRFVHRLRSPADVKPLRYMSTWAEVARRVCATCGGYRRGVNDIRREPYRRDSVANWLCTCSQFRNAALLRLTHVIDRCLRDAPSIVAEVSKQLKSTSSIPQSLWGQVIR